VRGLILSLLALLALAVTAGACEDQSYKEIGTQINVLTKRSHDDSLVEAASARLVGYGPRALPQIETALHAASELPRQHMVAVMDKMGDAEAIPILRHLAVYDAASDVRASCESILKGWAARPDERGAAAKLALARIDVKRADGEVP
jgi:hypothetical protein